MMLQIAPVIPATDAQETTRPGYWGGVLGRLLANRIAMAALIVLLAMALAILLAGWIAPHDPLAARITRRLRPIGTEGFWLGTDEVGRDMLSRLLHGGRQSWMLGITPVAIALLIGGSLGIVAGYFGGIVNMVIMRTTDVFYAFPSVLLAVAISGALGPGVGNVILSLTIVFIPPIVRISESVTTGVRNLDYLEAARASGAGALRIIGVQLLPNVLGPIIIYGAGLLSICMILSAGLSFLGLGARPPTPEWGLMLNSLRTAIYTQPLVTILPGACIFATSVCFNLISDGLRRAMDVKS